jgi:Flp pilus assembly protein TadG
MRLRVQSIRRRGATVVEMALLLPFLMFVFVVAVDYARVFYYGTILENCARNGAYYASNYPNSAYLYNDIYGYKSLDEAIYKDCTNMMSVSDPKSNPQYKVEYSTTIDGVYGATPTVTGFVKVTLNWDFRTVTKYPIVPSTVSLSRSVIMRMAPALPTFEATGS